MSTKSTSEKKILAEHINHQNKVLVLSVIREEVEISRAEIVKRTGLSAPTVTRIVDSLIQKENLVTQVGIGESSGGRPPVIVRFNAQESFVVGIDWGRTHINGIVANLNAETILSLDVPITIGGNFEEDITTLEDMINRLIEDSGVERKKVLGIGIAVAGYVHRESSNVEFSPNFGWKNINLKETLSQRFNIPIRVDNVSRVMAIGELCYGIGARIKDYIFINIGYGIGAAIISNGESFSGFDGFAGEFGHNNISPNPKYKGNRLCSCGKTDCLECYASGRGIAQSAREGIDANPHSRIHKLLDGKQNQLTTLVLAQAAKAGDDFARGIFNDAAQILGTAIANFSNVVNPKAVIIGGKVANTGEFFLDKVFKVFQSQTLNGVNRQIDITKSTLLEDAAVKGAVALILKEVMDLNVIQS